MNAFKRAITNIKRQPGKSGILLCLILILAILLSGAISVRQAINNTEESMMMRMPAIATLSLNVEAAAEEAGISIQQLGPEFWQADRPTIDELSAVGNLPYVRAYDSFMITSLFSRDLEWAMIEIDEQQLPPDVSLSSLQIAVSGIREWGGYVESFGGRGVANPDLTDIDAGLIELVSGRTFTQEEINNGEQVVIVSQLFAQTNNLYVGAIIEFENNVYNYAEFSREGIGDFTAHWHEERFMVAHRMLEFEVIGIFDTYREFNYQNYSDWGIGLSLTEEARIHNRIYMPISVAEDILIFHNEAVLSILDELLELFTHYNADDLVQEEPWVESIFVLYDSRYLDAFQTSGSELLPGFWEIDDLRSVNAGVITSMDTVRGIADLILVATAGATIIILTLIITLLLRDRRQEIGIYMALGEKKIKVITQFLTEITIVSTVAITIALFAGNGISAVISRNLLEQNLIENAQQNDNRFGGATIPWELALFNPGELSIEEILAMYDTSLELEVTVTFISIGIVVVFLSTVIPIAYIVKLQPKKILM